MAKSNKPMGNHEVGYKRPPNHSKYPQGTSGNPGGRRKGSENYKTIVKEEYEAQVEYNDNGEKRTGTYGRLLVKKEIHLALKGSVPALRNALDRFARIGESEKQVELELSDEDEALIERALEKKKAARQRARDEDIDAEDGEE